MKESNRVRFGILGTGWVAQRFMADLRDVRGARLEAVASRQRSRAEEVARRFGARRPHGTYGDLLNDEHVDVVYVASEHHEHAEHCEQALRCGKHVLCEKPFTLNEGEAVRVIELAKERKLFCMEAMWSRFMPATRLAKLQIDSGVIGVPQMLSVSFGVPTIASASSRFFDPARGGGAMLDRGVYGVSLAVWLMGKPEQIVVLSDRHSSGVDRSASVVLKFADSRLATVSASLGAYTGNDAVIAGTGGRVRILEPFWRPERISLEMAPKPQGATQSDLWPDSPRERVRRTVRKFVPSSWARSTVLRRPVQGYGYGYEAEEVVRCIREGLTESPILPLNDTRVVMQAMDEIRRKLG